MLLCKFCNSERKNDNSLRNHERLCKQNSDRKNVPKGGYNKGQKGRNQFTKAAALGLPIPKVSNETKNKISEKSKQQIWDEVRRDKHSIIMKKVVSENPESYTSSNRGRTKQIIKYGIKFQGKWELKFYEYCIKNKIEIIRSNEWFEYEWNGIRKYFPDFYLPGFNVYIEVKGYETERDRAKWILFPKKLVIIKKSQIEEIDKNIFDVVDFCVCSSSSGAESS